MESSLLKFAAYKAPMLDKHLVDKPTTEQMHLLLGLTERRYDSSSTILCSQRPVDERHRRMGGGAHAKSVIDRIVHNAVRMQMGDVSVRERSKLTSSPPKTGIDIDVYVPDAGPATQVAYSITGKARKCEVQSLTKPSRVQSDIRRLVIVTKEEQETTAVDGTSTEVIPAWRLLLQLAKLGALATDMPRDRRAASAC